MNVSNTSFFDLSPIYHDNINADFDTHGVIKEIFVAPMLKPAIASQPAVITDDNGNQLTDQDISEIIMNTCADTVNVKAESQAKDLLSQTLVSFNKNTSLNTSDAFTIQSMTKAKLPEPTNTIIYTPATDIIPNSRKFINGQCDYDTWFASLALYARPETLGFYFMNQVAFDEFKTWMSSQMATLGAVLPPETNKLAADFQQLDLKGLTESVLLRANDGENCEPQSFARLIVELLMRYTQVAGAGEFGILPFDVPELISPRSLVFVNVERHARATPKQIADEWKLIGNSVKTIPSVVSNKKLKKLTSAQRTLQKISSSAQAAMNAVNGPLQRAAKTKFMKTPPTSIDITRWVKKIIEKMSFVGRSMNAYKRVKMTYNMPNRRDPDDFNKMGKSVSTRYKPDIHLYVDTSGSISERHYQDAVKACIIMAKKLDINLYFNSFSHVMSQTTRLNTREKTKAQIYREFQKVEKVTGGTDYEQIWHFINSSKKRTQELSLIITDFEYTPPRHYVKHPKNLYYIPCSQMNWNNIQHYAQEFCNAMTSKDPMIRNHILC